MDAERKAGAILAGMEKAGGTKNLARGNVVLPRRDPTLSDLGVSKVQSSPRLTLEDILLLVAFAIAFGGLWTVVLGLLLRGR